ncbi:hypothetical protein ACWGDS_25845 [Streptomyces sp. NPDC055059]
MTAITGALYVDCGTGREDPATGRIRYFKPPRARYECLRCGGSEGPVIGAPAVREFVRDIRTEHHTRCTTATQLGAIAA